jgi:hypothetical protein
VARTPFALGEQTGIKCFPILLASPYVSLWNTMFAEKETIIFSTALALYSSVR